MKLNHQDLKDGLILQRAMDKVGAKEVYTLKTLHVKHEGKVLCGLSGALYNPTINMDISKLMVCKACQRKVQRLIDNQVKAELRNYWHNPDHKGAVVPVVAKTEKKKVVKADPTHEQPMMPDELLPVGNGNGKGLW